MAGPPPARSVSENRREREMFRYDSSLTTQSVHIDVANPVPRSHLRSSSDPALTAFAELATLRLNASRAFISLFDSKHQYIVAEATNSSPLTPSTTPSDLGDGEQLVLCGTAIPRSAGICELALVIPAHVRPLSDPHNAKLPVTIIHDISTDPRSSQRAFCRHVPQNRFYTGVPIRSRRGINIGVLGVFSDEPRKQLDDVSTRLMQDLSNVILDYLDAKRNREDHRRANRMVRGVGSFVEGKSTISGQRMQTNPEAFDDHPSMEGVLNKNQQSLQQQMDYSAANSSESGPNLGAPTRSASSHFPPAQPTTEMHAPDVSDLDTSVKSLRPASESVPESSDSHDMQIRRIFSKASNIVRESIEVESVLFLDASIGSFGGLADARAMRVKSSAASKSTSSSSDERSSICSSPEDSNDQQDSFCRVLGFSTSTLSSVDGDSPSQSQLSLPERFLAKLLRRYPEGKIFNFDQNGSLQSSDFSGDEVRTAQTPTMETAEPSPMPSSQPADPSIPRRRLRHPFSRRNEAKLLRSMFSGARSIAIVPLWDIRKQRWYAGGFVCTNTPTRVLTIEGELSYLRAFGTVIVSEVDRINAALVDKAKTDLLSSLSHELRSPLHGIILGAELLHDTPLDAFQGDTLVSIENCGRTLLETIDHLLDWSKINNFIGRPSRRRSDSAGTGDRGLRNRGQKISIEEGMMSITSNVEVDVLAEEVVESVCAGFSYQRISIAQLASNRPDEHADTDAIRRLDSMKAMEDMASRASRLGDLQLILGDVSVTLDIHPAVSWAFHTQPGAIRRILMNLLGNSLKYTTKGFINVSMTQAAAKGQPQRNNKVRIVVSDSGRGIGEDYLRNHIFSPFSQEDSMSAGAGLGLSLVQKIVVQLGGSIDIWSKVGHGSKVTVELPLQGTIPTSPTVSIPRLSGFNEFQASVAELRGLRVGLMGFPAEKGGEEPEDASGQTFNEGALVSNLCKEWLEMHVVDDSTNDELLPDLVLSSDRQLDRLLSERRHGNISTPVVVICRNALLARQLATSPRFTSKRAIFEFISQPIGPRKLAKVLLLSFRRWTRLQAAVIPTPTALSMTSADPSSIGPSSVGPSSIEGNPPTGLGLLHSPGASNEALPDVPAEGAISLNSQKDGPADETAKTTQNEEYQPEYFPRVPNPDSMTLPERLKEETMSTFNAASTISSPRPSKKDSSSVTSSSKKTRFLLVDDNSLNLKILASYMKKLGHKFETAMDGQEALKVFEDGSGELQCVLMDISMPKMDGFEATRRIRALETEKGLSRCHIFALTGLASASAQQEAFASGIDLFLTKPVRLKELSKILETKGIA
ncbi:Histidine kinase 5-like protein 1 [Colletotrichum chlorophyti]|uniref:Histidine kinase 5-like protein 1 n=1 Tax=Colletotrichum chlorophyti TaxID=708187 RepID=A0A1Q8RG58_9PEZI|nr:Histidine kinase 5-like protein 1 [Colletotrichum chlorophyti]